MFLQQDIHKLYLAYISLPEGNSPRIETYLFNLAVASREYEQLSDMFLPNFVGTVKHLGLGRFKAFI